MQNFQTPQRQQFFLKAAAVAFVWAAVVIFFADWIASQHVAVQFLLATVLFYLVPAVIIGRLSDKPARKALGVFFVAAAVDLFAPPFAVGFDGNVLPTDAILASASIDVFLQSLWSNAANGTVLFLLVYPVSFLVLLLLGAVLLTDKNVAEVLSA